MALTGRADQMVAPNSHTIWNLTHEGRVVQARLMLWQAWNSQFWIREMGETRVGRVAVLIREGQLAQYLEDLGVHPHPAASRSQGVSRHGLWS